MLKKISIKNFQSIEDISVELGKYTVIVGKSNSGKSAFLRSAKACLRNSFVPSNVMLGKNKSNISVEFDDSIVDIERGKSISKYVLNEKVFTKCGRDVPEDVQQAIRMPLVSGTDLNFSFQFDRPFLLAETGSQSGQVLGSLTNAAKLNVGSGEANKRKLQTSSKLKIRRQDLEKTEEELLAYSDLPSKKKALEKAVEVSKEIEKIDHTIDSYSYTIGRIEALQNELVDFPTLPNLDDVFDEIFEIDSLITKLTNIVKIGEAAIQKYKDIYKQIKITNNDISTLKDKIDKIPVCPECGQEII